MLTKVINNYSDKKKIELYHHIREVLISETMAQINLYSKEL